MRSSVRKNFLRSLLAFPLTVSCGFAQSPAISAESVSVSAVAKTAMSSQMNDLFISQWVQADAAGAVNGSVVTLLGNDSVSLSKIRVTLRRNGKVVGSADTNAGGEFSIDKVAPGMYNLHAEGNGSIAMFSLVVVGNEAGSHLASEVDVRVIGSSGRVMEILRGQSSPKMKSVAQASVAQAAVAPSSDPLGSGRRFATSPQVLLDNEGVLNGRIGKAASKVDMSNMSVFIVKDGQEVNRVRVAADGSFAVGGLAPACYGFIAAGDQGSAVVGFCAVGRGVVGLKKDEKLFVANGMLAAAALQIEVADPQPEPETFVETAPFVETTTEDSFGMGPGFGGGGGGSGGGAGGGGGLGLGGLAAIGGLTALGIVAGTANNNAAVASPIVP